MNEAAFSKSEALRFGWVTAKGNIGFFIAVTLIANVPPTAISLAVGPLSQQSTILGGVAWLVSALLSFVLTMGLLRICLMFTDGSKPEIVDLFSCFPLLFKWIIAYIVYCLIVVAGLILLIVPGIIWTIKFGFFSFFIIDRGDIGPIEALKESSRITQGSKGNLLLLGILIYGIMLLGVICLLIGLFWAIPTVGVALTFVYRKLIAHADSLAPEVAASSPSGSGLGASQDTM